jgi:hypothetical protein
MTRAGDRRRFEVLFGLGVALAMLAPSIGCDTPVSRPDAGRRDANEASLDAPGLDAPGLDAASADDAAVQAMVTPEICTNGIDEDRNGSIDDGCPCAVGTRRACWPGAPEHRSVGACVDGEQTCDSDGVMAAFSECVGATMPTREVRANDTDDDCDGTTDEPDAVCEPSEQRESTCDDGLDSDCDTATDCDDPDCRAGSTGDCTMRCAAEEVVCWGEVDDDCDMRTDCEDPDCAADPSCRPGSDCPDGQVRTYRQRRLGASAGASSIAPGDGQPPMSNDCEDGSCPAGQVRVVTATMNVCVPPPPECPEGRYANYTGYASWDCEPPCEIIVHYGGIYGGLNVCTERPRLSCPGGQSPTFVYETQEWVCRPTCDNTLYDRIVLDGAVVCVPC